MPERFAAHIALALMLFLLINWIGRHSRMTGYMGLHVIYRLDEAPAVNAAIRIGGPWAFLVLTSALLYTAQLDWYVEGFYRVAIYYVVFRLVFNVAYGRVLLLNWPKEIGQGTIIIAGAKLLDDQFISERVNLFPDLSTVGTEIWLLIGLFLFHVANQMRFESAASERRKIRYVLARAKLFRRRFSPELSIVPANSRLRALILAIMIYEDFNRPRPARIVENVAHRFGLARTLGLMQVTSDVPLSDKESVARGVRKVLQTWEKESLVDHGYESYQEYMTMREILKDYNPDDDYISEVSSICHIVELQLYPGSKDRLSRYEPLPVG